MTTAEPLLGDRLRLLPVQPDDVERLKEIRYSPSVHRWWGSVEAQSWPFDDPETEMRSMWVADRLVGFIQWYENDDERYRHAGIDLFVEESAQGQGLGRQAITLVMRHLVARGHHRVVIDPAAGNQRAIACYRACGFVPVGVMRRYERDVDGEGWHDGLLMEYVIENESISRRPMGDLPL
ncbi:MAG: GNAT family N-acetyltransferase [Actinomycetes bacterium]